MIDTVILHVPTFETYTVQNGDRFQIIGDVNDFGLDACARHIRKNEKGEKVFTDIYHAYESLPTSHAGIGHKFYHSTNKTLPYLEINCSVAKLMQGHNVYGVDDLVFGAIEMLGAIAKTYPKLAQYLDFSNTKVVRFDVTYSALCESRLQAENVRDYLRNVDFGRLRNQSVKNTKDHYNTVYFGSPQSKIGGFKLYCKGVEIENERKELQAQANKNCLASIQKLEKIFTQQLQDYADKLVRIEATFKTRHIKELGIPQNLWQLINYQLDNPNFYKELWLNKTQAMFNALKGQIMNYADDAQLMELLKRKLVTYIYPKDLLKRSLIGLHKPSFGALSSLNYIFLGKPSYTRAKNAYNLYKRIQQDGYYHVKKLHNLRTFQRNVKALADAGISIGFLQNLKTQGQILPVLEILTIDFANQFPEGYLLPTITPEFVDQFKPYILKAAA